MCRECPGKHARIADGYAIVVERVPEWLSTDQEESAALRVLLLDEATGEWCGCVTLHEVPETKDAPCALYNETAIQCAVQLILNEEEPRTVGDPFNELAFLV